MESSIVWTAVTIMGKLLEIITYVKEDPLYTNEDMIQKLEEAFDEVDHLYQLGMQNKFIQK